MSTLILGKGTDKVVVVVVVGSHGSHVVVTYVGC